MATPPRVMMRLEQRAAILDTGLSLGQLEILSGADDWSIAFTSKQRWLWRHVIFPIGVELGDYYIVDEPPEEDDHDEYI